MFDFKLHVRSTVALTEGREVWLPHGVAIQGNCSDGHRMNTNSSFRFRDHFQVFYVSSNNLFLVLGRQVKLHVRFSSTSPPFIESLIVLFEGLPKVTVLAGSDRINNVYLQGRPNPAAMEFKTVMVRPGVGLQFNQQHFYVGEIGEGGELVGFGLGYTVANYFELFEPRGRLTKVTALNLNDYKTVKTYFFSPEAPMEMRGSRCLDLSGKRFEAAAEFENGGFQFFHKNQRVYVFGNMCENFIRVEGKKLEFALPGGRAEHKDLNDAAAKQDYLLLLRSNDALVPDLPEPAAPSAAKEEAKREEPKKEETKEDK